MIPETQTLYPIIQATKVAIALSTCGLLLWTAALHRAGRPERFHRQRDVALAALGLAGALAWSNFLQFHIGHYIHSSDYFHYYMGAKYFPELRYTGLYECTAAAEVLDGHSADVARRLIRNLETNDLGSGAAIAATPNRCKDRFSVERWDDFRRDVRWFRGIHTDAAWAKIHVDHGFNGTPVWLIAGWTLANASPTTGRSVIVLSLVDWLLLAIMWGFVWRAFGWRTMCVALVFWGTNYPGHFGWTGGSFLRQDWLAALLIGLCLLRMERPMAAGFMITTAALLRIYPGFVFIAIALQAAVAILSEKRLYLAPAHVRGAIGALLVIVVVVPSSRLITGDLSLWSDFFANLELHAGTRGANRTSLETWVSHDATRSMSRLEALDLDAFYVSDAWIQARKAKFEERRLMYWGSVIALLALLATAVRREALWVVGALGLGLIPIIADPSNYYLGAFIGVALLAQRNATLGAAACAMAALTVLTSRVLFWPDELFVGVSIEVVLLVIFVWAYAATKSPSLELAGGSPPTARGEVST